MKITAATSVRNSICLVRTIRGDCIGMGSASSLDGCLSAAGSLAPSRCIQVGATLDRPDYQKQGKSLHRRLNGNKRSEYYWRDKRSVRLSNRAAIVVAHSCIHPSSPLGHTASFQS